MSRLFKNMDFFDARLSGVCCFWNMQGIIFRKVVAIILIVVLLLPLLQLHACWGIVLILESVITVYHSKLASA